MGTIMFFNASVSAAFDCVSRLCTPGCEMTCAWLGGALMGVIVCALMGRNAIHLQPFLEYPRRDD